MLTPDRLARIAFLADPSDPWAAWTAESLRQGGLLFDVVDRPARDLAARYDLFLDGGMGLAPLGKPTIRIGASQRGTEDQIHRVAGPWPEGCGPIRLYGVDTQVPEPGQEVLATDREGRAAILRLGNQVHFGPHLGRTLAAMALGQSVDPTDAGRPGRTLDDASRGPMDQPHADLLRELFFSLLLELAEASHLRVAFLATWPNAMPSLGCLSVDCDTPEYGHLYALQQTLSMTGSRATLFCSPAAYGADLYRHFKTLRQEVGLLIGDLDTPDHLQERIHIQLANLQRISANPGIHVARTVNGTWIGRTKLPQAAEAAGIRVLSCRGPYSPRMSGFPFGTALPFDPSPSLSGSPRMLELPFQVSEPGVVTPNDSVEPILEETVRRGGLCQVSARASCIQDPAGLSGLRRWLSLTRHLGVRVLSLDSVAVFTRARLSVGAEVTVSGELRLFTDTVVPGLCLLVSGSAIHEAGSDPSVHPVRLRRFGAELTSLPLDLQAHRSTNLRLVPWSGGSLAA